MKYFFLLIVGFLIFSCSNKLEFEKKYNCSTSSLSNSKQLTDFKKNYTINIPKDWKTEYYYSNVQSEIVVADTIKNLTSSYVLATSFNLGELNFDEKFYNKRDSLLQVNQLFLISSGKEILKEKPSFWYISKGNKNGFLYHQLNFLIKTSKSSYFNATTKVYGNENIEERFCEAVSIIKTVNFLE